MKMPVVAQFMRLLASVCICVRLFTSRVPNACVCSRLCASVCVCSRQGFRMRASARVCVRLPASVCVCVCVRLRLCASASARVCLRRSSCLALVVLSRVCVRMCASACECLRELAHFMRLPASVVLSRVIQRVQRWGELAHFIQTLGFLLSVSRHTIPLLYL